MSPTSSSASNFSVEKTAFSAINMVPTTTRIRLESARLFSFSREIAAIVHGVLTDITERAESFTGSLFFRTAD